jgi:hypothetical protein
MTTFFGMGNFGKVSIENLDSKQVEVTNIIVKKNNHGLTDILYAFIVLCILVLGGIALVWWETLVSYLPIAVILGEGNDGPRMLIPGEETLRDKIIKNLEEGGEANISDDAKWYRDFIKTSNLIEIIIYHIICMVIYYYYFQLLEGHLIGDVTE